MGQQVSRDEQTALAVIDRVCEKLERIYGTYQATLIRNHLIKKHKLVKIKAKNTICSANGVGYPFLLVRGRLKVGNFEATRPGLFGLECAYGFKPMLNITATEDSVIFRFNQKADLTEQINTFHHMIRYGPVFPIHAEHLSIKQYLHNASKETQTSTFRQKEISWKVEIAATITDSILQLSNPDELFDVGERPDYQEFLTKIISYFREEPKYVSVPDTGKAVILQRKGDVPTQAWLLAMGSIEIKDSEEIEVAETGSDDEEDYNEDFIMTDSDAAVVLESEVCLQMPTYKTYVIQPGSIVISMNRRALIALQFMKTFDMDPNEAICAAEQSYVMTLKSGQKVEESRFFKGIIFFGKLSLVALPPGRASEHETVRRSTLQAPSFTTDNLPKGPPDSPIEKSASATNTQRKSCRIATVLETAFEKCGPYDIFQAIDHSIVLISVGVPQSSITEDLKPL